MIIREYGDSAARVILVQPVGQHELPLIDDEIVQIGQMTGRSAILRYRWKTGTGICRRGRLRRYSGMRTSVTAQKHCLRKSCRFAQSRIKTI